MIYLNTLNTFDKSQKKKIKDLNEVRYIRRGKNEIKKYGYTITNKMELAKKIADENCKIVIFENDIIIRKEM